MTLNHRRPSPSAGVPKDSASFPLPAPTLIPIRPFDDGRHSSRSNVAITCATVTDWRRHERSVSSLPRSSRARHASRGGSRAAASTLQNRWVARSSSRASASVFIALGDTSLGARASAFGLQTSDFRLQTSDSSITRRKNHPRYAKIRRFVEIIPRNARANAAYAPRDAYSSVLSNFHENSEFLWPRMSIGIKFLWKFQFYEHWPIKFQRFSFIIARSRPRGLRSVFLLQFTCRVCTAFVVTAPLLFKNFDLYRTIIERCIPRAPGCTEERTAKSLTGTKMQIANHADKLLASDESICHPQTRRESLGRIAESINDRKSWSNHRANDRGHSRKSISFDTLNDFVSAYSRLRQGGERRGFNWQDYYLALLAMLAVLFDESRRVSFSMTTISRVTGSYKI